MIWPPLARILVAVYAGYTFARGPSAVVIVLLVIVLALLVVMEFRHI